MQVAAIKLRYILTAALTASAVTAAPRAAHAEPVLTLAAFRSVNGANPGGGVVFGRDGALYGTTANGGASGYGTVYKLKWDFTAGRVVVVTLHSFNGYDGAFPESALVQGRDGILYGTAFNSIVGYGTVFRIDPESGAFAVLYTFTNGADGALPNAELILDGEGGAYGTTTSGALGYGTVFRLDLASNLLTTLHTFDNTDGAYPYTGLVFDREGKLWGTAPGGGANLSGVLYKLDPVSLAYAVEYDFGGAQGVAPEAGLAIAEDGSLYGTTAVGGLLADCVAPGGSFAGCGVLYRFDPRTGTYAVLHSFTGGADGGAPEARLVQGDDGVYYGTTFLGGRTADCAATAGIPPGCGTIFRFDPEEGALTTIHAFTGRRDGANPFAPVLLGPAEILFGVASAGGDLAACPSSTSEPGCGTVYVLAP